MPTEYQCGLSEEVRAVQIYLKVNTGCNSGHESRRGPLGRGEGLRQNCGSLLDLEDGWRRGPSKGDREGMARARQKMKKTWAYGTKEKSF